MAKESTYEVPEELTKENWKEEHLQGKHEGYEHYFAWCQLCMNKQEGDKRKEEWEGL